MAVLDGRHATAYRATIRECWSNAPNGFSEDELFWLFEGLMLQRTRTPRAADGLAHGSENLVLQAFVAHLKASDREMHDRMIEAMDKGQVSVKENPLRSLLHSLSIGLQSVIGITDLNLALFRNFTKLPFVFGDAPCVFYNRYLYDFTSVGVLGIQSPGLMILMPLDHTTQVLLYDPATYEMPGGRVRVDVIESADTAQLNALQVHSAKTAIYFADRGSADQLIELVTAHRPLFKQSHNKFRQLPPGAILIDGVPNEQEAMQIFESQLPIRIDLSFIKTKTVPPDENPRRARSPELRDELKRIQEVNDGETEWIDE